MKLCNAPIPEKKKKKKTWKWGINGPCGQFKITNTVDDQVDLTPGDIPDAGFSEEELEKTDRCSTKVLIG